MAGKHTGAYENSDDPLPFEWNERTTKAYAEGRAGLDAKHDVGSDAERAFVAGQNAAANIADQFETATIGTI